MRMKKEPRKVSILKAITWRIIATSTTFLLAYFIFSASDCENVMEKSTIVAGLEMVIKIVFYYLHERVWLRAKKAYFEPAPNGT
jgi:uncharacterized membrane protein